MSEAATKGPGFVAQGAQLDVHNSSVTQALRSLSDKGLVNYAPYDLVTLTDQGREAATDVVERHRSLRSFLVEVLGLDPKRDAAALRRMIGSQLQESALPDRIKVWEALDLFGTDYPTPDGTCIRDYIHVVDLARAHVVALQRLLSGKNDLNYEIFNVGTGKGSSVLEVIQSFERVSGLSLNYKIVGRRPGDITEAYADTTRANEVLGWKAESSLDDAMKSAWAWEQKVREK